MAVLMPYTCRYTYLFLWRWLVLILRLFSSRSSSVAVRDFCSLFFSPVIVAYLPKIFYNCPNTLFASVKAGSTSTEIVENRLLCGGERRQRSMSALMDFRTGQTHSRDVINILLTSSSRSVM